MMVAIKDDEWFLSSNPPKTDKILSVIGWIVESPLVLDDPYWDLVYYNPHTEQWLQSINGEDVEVVVSHWKHGPNAPLG